MVERKPLLQNEKQASGARRIAPRILFVVILLLLLSSAAAAIPISEYHKHIQQAVTALAAVAQSKETESEAVSFARDVDTILSVRTLLPQNVSVESNGASFNVDNSWLHQDLDKYAAEKSAERYNLLRRTTERLKAIEERLTELEKPVARIGGSKEEDSRRLAEILRRSEYAHEAKKRSAVSRLIDDFKKWLRSWFPKPQPLAPGRAAIFSKIAQVVIIALALGVLAFVLKLFLPRFLHGRKARKKDKATARIVLGERLEPDQSALDLLTEAEALARRGELRAAIRKAYIALLVELGERKIISLAQHKTNRDYLRAVRAVEPLYGDVKQLTDSFERHWYGLAKANETDWLAFRAVCKQALSR
jgi:hypothetical protein